MSRNLLSNDLLDQMLKAEGSQLVIDVLMNSDYGTDLSAALGRDGGIEAAEEALRNNLFRIIQKIVEISPPKPRRLVEIQLNWWDLANIVAIIRGKHAALEPEEILKGTVPAGVFNPSQLIQLCEEADIPSVADALTTWGSPYGSQVRQIIHEQKIGEDLTDLETRLYSRFFEWVFEELDAKNRHDAVLLRCMRLQADLVNVVTALRVVQFRRAQNPAPDPLYIPGGTIANSTLQSIANAENLDYAIEALDTSIFSPAVERGILSFGRDNKLSSIERFLEAEVIEKNTRLFRSDPLSAGVPIGYIWRKVSEYQNIRMIIRGKKYNFPPNSIREALILV